MRPMAEVEVSGLNGTVTLQALIDTGFSGYVCLPATIAENLGLVFSGQEKYELANGEWVTQFYFKGKVRFLGQTSEVDILVSDSDTAQIGTFLLGDCRLSIDFTADKVRLTRKKM